jgi:beta-lactamase class A
MAPTPTIAPPQAASTRLQPLLAELESLLEGWEGKHAVSVTDLQTGETISVNGSRRQLAACTIKIPIMIAVAQDIESGRYSADEVVELVKAAMGPSYTPPARELLRLVGQGDIGAGVRRVNAILREFGARGSILTHPPGYPQEEYGYKASHGIDENLLTTGDLNLLLSRLYRRELLSDWATDYVLQSLTIAPDWMDAPLRAHLPSSARVYHKIGQLYESENVWNDAGIVVHESDGRTVAYAISYLGSYGGSWREAYAHETEIAAIVWSYFGGDGLAAVDGGST